LTSGRFAASCFRGRIGRRTEWFLSQKSDFAEIRVMLVRDVTLMLSGTAIGMMT
jgi:hypothetical protein